MAFTEPSRLQEVHGIEDDKKSLIKAFLQGAVYCWGKNRKGEPFAVRDLMGGDNFEWQGTPLYVLYEKHFNGGKDNDSAIKAAAIDLGWLLKTVLAEDKRTFKISTAGRVNTYEWIGNEP